MQNGRMDDWIFVEEQKGDCDRQSGGVVELRRPTTEGSRLKSNIKFKQNISLISMQIQIQIRPRTVRLRAYVYICVRRLLQIISKIYISICMYCILYYTASRSDRGISYYKFTFTFSVL